ncbi:MAG TPA: SPOR domain-containing protein [bacterium]|nr:SPOR domain-containing protein [bacterium]
MGLFNRRKKTEQLRTLSEKEIQEKLYGRFQMTMKETSLESPPMPALKNSFQTATLDNADHKPGDLFSFSSASVKTNAAPRPAKYEEEEGEIEFPKSVPAPLADLDSKTVQGSKFAERDSRETKPRAFTKPPSSGPAFAPRPKLTGGGVKFFQNAAAAIGKGIGSILSLILKLVAGFFEGSIVFLKRGQNRYWVGALVFLSILLVSIHHLNVRREIAMKAPRPRHTESSTTPHISSRSAVPAAASSSRPLAQEISDQTSPLSATNVDSETPTQTLGPTESDGLFVVQIVTYANEDDAIQLQARLRQDGLQTLLRKSTRSSGKTYFTVFVGRFKTYREAQEMLARFQKKEISKPFQDAFIRTLQ